MLFLVGHTATHAVVLARLITRGVDHGIHPFIVQLRSLEDHTPLPGAILGGRGGRVEGGVEEGEGKRGREGWRGEGGREEEGGGRERGEGGREGRRERCYVFGLQASLVEILVPNLATLAWTMDS